MIPITELYFALWPTVSRKTFDIVCFRVTTVLTVKWCMVVRRWLKLFPNVSCTRLCHVQGKTTLVTPILSLATPSNLGAGSNFPSALPTGFTTGICVYVFELPSEVKLKWVMNSSRGDGCRFYLWLLYLHKWVIFTRYQIIQCIISVISWACITSDMTLDCLVECLIWSWQTKSRLWMRFCKIYNMLFSHMWSEVGTQPQSFELCLFPARQ